MEAIGLAASLLTIVGTAKTLIDIVCDIKDASMQRNSLLRELSISYGLLHSWHAQVHRETTEDPLVHATRALLVPGGPLDQFKHNLEDLVASLSAHSKLGKLGKSLKWPFEKETFDRKLASIVRIQGLVSLLFQQDQVWVMTVRSV